MLQIDHNKNFPVLSCAPIVEAVLHWQASLPANLCKEDLTKQLRESFPEYVIAPLHNFEMALSESPDGMEVRHSKAWEGFRLTKEEEGQPAFVCQFRRDGLIFSRLAPYDSWPSFKKEAMKFWEKFVEIGKSPEIAKLSTRFISQIPINNASEVKIFIDNIPEPLTGIGIFTEGFLYQDTAKLPDLPYTVTVVRAL